MSVMSLQQIADALKAAVAEPHLRLDANGKLADLEALFTIENVARAGQAQALADAETADVTVELCGRPVRSWLIEEQLLDPAEAGRRMRLVRGLPDAPATFAAWKADRITGAHALLILKVLPHITDPEPRSLVEAALVEESSWRPPYVVARMVEEILTTLGVETGRDAHDRRFAERGVGVDATFGGAGSLNGTLTPRSARSSRPRWTPRRNRPARRTFVPVGSDSTTRSARSATSTSPTPRTSLPSAESGLA